MKYQNFNFELESGSNFFDLLFFGAVGWYFIFLASTCSLLVDVYVK